MRIHILTLLLVFGLYNLAGAQPDRLINDQNFTRLAFASPGSHVLITTNRPQLHIENTPFYNENWLPGRVKIIGHDTFSRWAGVILELDKGELYVQLEEDFISNFPLRWVNLLQIDESGKITTFMVRDLFSDHNAGPKGHKFYEIIHLGEKYTLLKCHTKFLRKEDYVENLGMVRRPNKYMELYSYWVLAGNSLRPAGANKAAMKKAIPEKANRIDSYVKSKKLQLKKKEGLAQLMQLLEK